MPVSIAVPQLGESVAEGTVSKWLKSVGERVRKEEPLVEIQTDKINVEIPSPAEGVLQSISVPEGTTVLVGTEIAVPGGVGEEAAPARAEPERAAATAPARAPAPAREAGPRPGFRTAAVAPAGAGAREEVVPFTKVRKLIAENMVRAKATAAHVTTFDEVDMTAIVELRKAWGPKLEGQ